MSAEAVVVDTNLFLLLVVGMASDSYVVQHKRLRQFSVEDYHLLLTLLSTYSQIIVTPNTVTETSNLAVYISNPTARPYILQALGCLLETAKEHYIASRDVAISPVFLRLGITDAALLHTDLSNALLLTADLDLCLEAAHQGRPVINFNHHIEANRPSA